MSKTNRRAFLGALAASGATLTATQLAAAPGKLGFSEMKKARIAGPSWCCESCSPWAALRARRPGWPARR